MDRMIQVIFMLLIIIVPLLMAFRVYKKFNEEEKVSFKREIKDPEFLLTGGLGFAGFYLMFSAGIFGISQTIGACMLMAAIFISGLYMAESNIKKSLLLIAIAFTFAGLYFFAF